MCDMAVEKREKENFADIMRKKTESPSIFQEIPIINQKLFIESSREFAS